MNIIRGIFLGTKSQLIKDSFSFFLFRGFSSVFASCNSPACRSESILRICQPIEKNGVKEKK
jgi:hypothetical protein